MVNESQLRHFAESFIHFRRDGRMVPEHEIISDLITLLKYERALSQINLNESNGWPREITERRDGKKFIYNVPDEEWKARDKKREISIQGKVGDIMLKYGFGLEFNGDPRGGAIRVILPSGISNSWDGKTWCFKVV
jgi:hypothetical protein